MQPVNPRSRKVQPYFPGYLFVHVDLERVGRSCIEWTPGAAGLVFFGGEPASVSDGLVASIKQRIESLRVISDESPVPFCKGDNIVVREGVFNGYEGIFDVQLSGTDRVRIFLSLLDHRKIPIELSASYVCLLD